MKQIPLVLGLTVVLLSWAVACETVKPAGESKKAGAVTALNAPASSPGWRENDAGVRQYEQGHWDVAADHFRKSLKTDPNLAEAHFNLGLALDKIGKHGDAVTSFQKAADLAWKTGDSAITESPILKEHLGY